MNQKKRCSLCQGTGHNIKTCERSVRAPGAEQPRKCSGESCPHPAAPGKNKCEHCLAVNRRNVRKGRARRGMPVSACGLCQGDHSTLDCPDRVPAPAMWPVAADVDEMQRPATRRDCLPGGCNQERPCPWISCKWHLVFEVQETTGQRGPGLRRRHVSLQRMDDDTIVAKIEALAETCALDVADRGGQILDEVGQLIGVGRERIRQIEKQALAKLERRGQHLSDLGFVHPEGWDLGWEEDA